MGFAADFFHQAEILVVDHNATHAAATLSALHQEGYRRLRYRSAPLPIDSPTPAAAVDLIIYNLDMPGKGHLAQLNLLKEQLRVYAPAVLLLCSALNNGLRFQALELGVHAFLIKPFNTIEGLQRTYNLLQLRHFFIERHEQTRRLEAQIHDRTKELLALSRQEPVNHLPNRAVVLETLQQLLDRQQPVLTFFISLHGLDEVMRMHGYEIADLAARQLIERIHAMNDPPCHLLGAWTTDKWVVLHAGPISVQTIQQLAQQLLDTVQIPIHLERLKVYIRARIGISGSLGQSDAETIIRRASLSLPTSDHSWQAYSLDIERRLSRHVKLRNELYQAVARKELKLHYQPKLCLTNNKLVGVEALLRWHNAELGHVSPAEFIPVAEGSGVIINLGKWILQEAIRHLKKWHEQDLVQADFTMAVNVAPLQLMQADFSQWLIQTMHQARLSPALLELEVTESTLMHNLDAIQQQLYTLQAAGFSIAIDDFGTGYSSLRYLKALPVNTLKIDRFFIQDIHLSANDQLLIQIIIDMGKHLGFTVVAEGVELVEQLQLLQAMGCNLIQGYLLAPPLNAQHLVAFMQSKLHLDLHLLT